MGDPQEPRFPDTAPLELREFVACRRASVTLRNGKLDWLPLPPELASFPTPDLTIEPGGTDGTATLNVGFGIFSIALPATIVDGQLQVDTSGLGDMLGGAAQPIADWQRGLNDWLRHNGQRFGAAKVASGEVTLVKEPVPAAAPPSDPPQPPPVAPPAGAGGGAVQPPPPDAGAGSGCLKWIGLGVLLLVAGAIGFVAFDPFGVIGGPSSTATPVALAPTPSTASTASAASTAPSLAPSRAPSTSDAPTSAPSVAPLTQPPATDPIMPPDLNEEELFGLAAGEVNFLTGGALALPDDAGVLLDGRGDLFSFSGNVSDTTPWIDLAGAVGWRGSLSQSAARTLTGDFPCGQVIDLTGVLASCNQQQPLRAGDYVFVATAWNAPLADPFPEQGNCSWAIQTNIDDDLETGFPNPPPRHPLHGADRYFETLMFWQNGQFQNYVLGTDYDAPPRTDTKSQYGNLFTRTRVLVLPHGQDAPDMMWALFIVPGADFGGNNFSAHGYCYGDVTDPNHTLGVDGMGDHDESPFPDYWALDLR